MKKRILLAAVLILTAMFFITCGDDPPTESTNNPPTQPLNNTGAGSPASGASDVPLNPVLAWTCSDPDGDALTYTVSFGTISSPPEVSVEQTANTYSPTGLDYSTTYYWRVRAFDDKGAFTTSTLLVFTTTDPPAETITTPAVPIGDVSGEENTTLYFSSGTATSSYAHSVEYRFDWGDGSFSAWSTSTAASFIWFTAGTYDVKSQARCVDHPTIVSAWSPSLTVTITASAVETVSTPDAPGGPSSGYVDSTLIYSTANSVSSDGHSLEYQFDWGDGSFSTWSVPSGVSNTWTADGTYDVRAKARCQTHPSIESGWSVVTPVTITTPVVVVETVSMPSILTSNAILEEAGTSVNFATGGGISSEGHPVAYRFDWGNGTISTWAAIATRSYTWSTAGTYDVKVQAQCISHPTIMSGWTAPLTMTITVPATETVSAPGAPTAPDTAEVNTVQAVYLNGFGVSSYGHTVRHRIDFGDGNISPWLQLTNGLQHTWTSTGSFDIKVQAQCFSHQSIVSAWSEVTTIEIVDPPEEIQSLPGTINGVAEGAINEAYDYIVYHSSQTNLSDPVEGQFDWGDGTTSAWISAPPYEASHTWTTEGTYVVKYLARCATHTTLSASADSLIVNIATSVAETIDKPGYVNLQDPQELPDLNVPTDYYAFGSASSLGHETESRIDWGDGTPMSDWTIGFTKISKTWTVEGTFEWRRQTRCVAHPTIISEWSDPQNIYPRGPETINAPPPPFGPATAIKGQYVYLNATGASSSWGHDNWLEYRFDWGDGSALSVWQQADTSVQRHIYNTLGDYEVKIQARDAWPGHVAPESDWSLPATISIVEGVTTNGSANGPAYGGINLSYTFGFNSASSNAGHTLEYRWDFDDGTISAWTTDITTTHTFTAAGTYYVLFQARCATHTTAESEWTTPWYTIEITDGPEAVTTPEGMLYYVPNNWASIAKEITLTPRKSINNYNDSIEYQVDFGNGVLSGWYLATFSGSNGWNTEIKYTYPVSGTYDAKARARCATHTSIVSDWTAPRTILVYEHVEAPAIPTGDPTGTVDVAYTASTTGAISSDGHDLEYRFVYRTATGFSNLFITDWAASLSDIQTFTTAGDYRVMVQARCIEHPIPISNYSDFFYFTIQ